MAGLFGGLKWTDKDKSKVYNELKGNFEVLEDGLGLPFSACKGNINLFHRYQHVRYS